MNTEQVYINGFVKRAMEYGFDENEAFAILKEANALTRALARGAVKPATIASRMNMSLPSVQNISAYNRPGVGINKNKNIQNLDSTLAKRNNLMKTQSKVRPAYEKLEQKFGDFEDMASDINSRRNDFDRIYEDIEDTKKLFNHYNVSDNDVLKRWPKMQRSENALDNVGNRVLQRNSQIGSLDRKAYSLGAPANKMSNPGVVNPEGYTIDMHRNLSEDLGQYRNTDYSANKGVKFHPDAKRTQQAFLARQDLQNMRQQNKSNSSINY